MRSKKTVLVLLLTLALTGCTAGDRWGVSTDGDGSGSAPDLTQVDSPYHLTRAELATGLERYVNADEHQDKVAALDVLYQRWGLSPRKDEVLLVETDLNGDGTSEIVTALNGAANRPEGLGAVFVIYQKDGGWTVDWTPEEQEYPGVRLHGVADLTGDGRPEILWSTTSLGAHTGITRVWASQWEPGTLIQLDGEMTMASTQVTVDGGDVVLEGGRIQSVGAGGLQREREDRYRWQKGSFQLVSRQYAPSDLGYHRLIDGITAEQFRDFAAAEAAYREVLDPGRPAVVPGELQLDGRPASEVAQSAGDAVRTLARLRLAALKLQEQNVADAQHWLRGATGTFADMLKELRWSQTREQLCQGAQAYAAAQAELIHALNSAWGYAEPHWSPPTLCGPLPQVP